MIRLGLADLSLFQNPNYVLNADEMVLIQQRVANLNEIIYHKGVNYGFPVVNVSEKFHEVFQTHPIYAGVRLSARYLGGLFSLDGFHPSNIGHALTANEFLSALKTHYGWGAPLISKAALDDIAAKNPFVDLDGDGRVRGRPLAGVLETLGPVLGISGDVEDVLSRSSAMVSRDIDRAQALSLLDSLRDPDQRGSAVWTQDQIQNVFRKVFRVNH